MSRPPLWPWLAVLILVNALFLLEKNRVAGEKENAAAADIPLEHFVDGNYDDALDGQKEKAGNATSSSSSSNSSTGLLLDNGTNETAKADPSDSDHLPAAPPETAPPSGSSNSSVLPDAVDDTGGKNYSSFNPLLHLGFPGSFLNSTLFNPDTNFTVSSFGKKEVNEVKAGKNGKKRIVKKKILWTRKVPAAGGQNMSAQGNVTEVDEQKALGNETSQGNLEQRNETEADRPEVLKAQIDWKEELKNDSEQNNQTEVDEKAKFDLKKEQAELDELLDSAKAWRGHEEEELASLNFCADSLPHEACLALKPICAVSDAVRAIRFLRARSDNIVHKNIEQHIDFVKSTVAHEFRHDPAYAATLLRNLDNIRALLPSVTSAKHLLQLIMDEDLEEELELLLEAHLHFRQKCEGYKRKCRLENGSWRRGKACLLYNDKCCCDEDGQKFRQYYQSVLYRFAKQKSQECPKALALRKATRQMVEAVCPSTCDSCPSGLRVKEFAHDLAQAFRHEEEKLLEDQRKKLLEEPEHKPASDQKTSELHLQVNLPLLQLHDQQPKTVNVLTENNNNNNIFLLPAGAHETHQPQGQRGHQNGDELTEVYYGGRGEQFAPSVPSAQQKTEPSTANLNVLAYVLAQHQQEAELLEKEKLKKEELEKKKKRMMMMKKKNNAVPRGVIFFARNVLNY